ncbi:MAG: DUF4230 domain-containing protein [Gammaproteobacteria bacterium]|nr:DUF4230 domain-containing protein [Gammaproteobacteria bacterium]
MLELTLLLLALALLAIAGVWGGWLKRRSAPAATIEVQSSIEQMKAIGQLSVFKVITREIVTSTDHSWGEFGAKYLSWMLSKKKMAMIFEFEIDFRFDLRRPEFQIRELGEQRYLLHMPPCQHQVFIRDIQFYDEQHGKLLPWLLPDLLNGFLATGFAEADKNRLVAAARDHAEAQARNLISDLQSDVNQSAKSTLEAIAKGFAARQVSFEFDGSPTVDLNVGMASDVAA